MDCVYKKENLLEVKIEDNEAVLGVELGWDVKEMDMKERIRGRIEVATMGVSAKCFDLNLAAILIHSDGSAPELVCHEGLSGCGISDSAAIVLGRDDRTGANGGSDETMSIDLSKMPDNVERVILFMDINGANSVNQHLSDVEGVFVQIRNEKDCKVYLREEEAFKDECAKDYCNYAFAELRRENTGWALHGMSRYSCEDCECETLKAFS